MTITNSDNIRIDPVEGDGIDVEALQLRILKRPQPDQPVIKVSHIRLIVRSVAVLVKGHQRTVAAKLALVDVLRDYALHQQ